MKALTTILALLLATTLMGQAPALEIEGYQPKEGAFLVEGQACKIRVTGGELQTLLVTYRPGSKVEKKNVKVEVDAEGVAEWTPEAPGLVKFVATYFESQAPENPKPADRREKKTIEKVVSVAFASKITVGLGVMILAGIMLFGGAAISIRSLLRS